MRLLLASLALAAAGPVEAQIPVSAAPLRIGTSHVLQSAPLGEPRTINVVLPASYARERGRRYRVLYLLDGGVEQDLLHVAGVAHLNALWGRSAEAIVVGIETNDRRRELVGPTRDPELLKSIPRRARQPPSASSSAKR